MAGGPRGRRKSTRARRRSVTPHARKPRGFLLSVSSRGEVLDVSLPVPRPDNWEDLGLSRFPPPVRAPFYIETAARWSADTLRPVLAELLREVGHRAASFASLKLFVRYGEEDDDGGVIYQRANAKDGSGGIEVYSEKFNEAHKRWEFENYKALHQKDKAKRPKPPRWNVLTRRNLDDFMDLFESKDRGRYLKTAYIYRLGIALLKNRRPYKQPNRRAERGAWKQRIEDYKRGELL